MIEQDTVRLLRECDKGVKMGVSAIDDVMGYVKRDELKQALNDCRSDHLRLEDELEQLLHRYHDEGKEPGLMLKGMSKMKTTMKLAANTTDSTVADLITDGCNMGIKSLSKFLNEYKAAEEVAKDITKKLISQEEELSVRLRDFL